MSQKNAGTSDRSASGSSRGFSRLPRWQKILLGLSVALMLTGAALHAVAHVRASSALPDPIPVSGEVAAPASPSQTLRPAPVRSFLPGVPSPSAPKPADEPEAGEPAVPVASQNVDVWAPATFRVGFSFFVGFCIAYALRSFFRISLVAMGTILLALFALQYAGILTVNWPVMEAYYGRMTAWLSTQTTTLREFVTGQLPSAAMATLGLAAGFKR